MVPKGKSHRSRPLLGLVTLAPATAASGCSKYFSLVAQPLNFKVAESLSMVNDLLEKIIFFKFNEIKKLFVSTVNISLIKFVLDD